MATFTERMVRAARLDAAVYEEVEADTTATSQALGVVFLVAAVWMLIAGIIAVRQALDYRGTGRAVVVVLIGWGVQWLIIIVLLSLLRRPAF